MYFWRKGSSVLGIVWDISSHSSLEKGMVSGLDFEGPLKWFETLALL